jgi:hypothetical protein
VTTSDDPIAAIRAKFDVTDFPHKWIISCPYCRTRWELNKPDPEIGSILRLLNHAAMA